MKESLKSGLLSDITEEVIDNLFRNYTGIIRQKIEALNNFKLVNFIKC